MDKIGEAIAEWRQLSAGGGGGDEEEAESGCEEEWRFVLQSQEGQLSNNQGRGRQCRPDGEGTNGRGAASATGCDER